MVSALLAIVVLCGSCIKNNIPYPRIQVNFRQFVVEGQTRQAQIDSVNMVLTAYIGETVDPYDVHVTEYAITPKAEIVDNTFDAGGVDMSADMVLTLRLYQDYKWVVRAVQDIRRYFTVEGQIGSPVIDPVGRRVIVQIPQTADASRLHVLTAKLGPEGSVITPDIAGTTVDASLPLKLEVSSFGRTQEWTVYVEKTEAMVTTVRADGWTRVAWIYGQAQVGAEYGVEYRIKGDSEWKVCPQDWITSEGGDFRARLTGLLPMTTYEARAISGGDEGAVMEFTTGQDIQIGNMMLDDWWKDGKVWCPWTEGGEQVWDTGNKGATTLGDSNSTPTEDTSTGTGQAARLETRFVGIGPLGKLAAGNIFVGKYVRTDGTNGVLSFGHPFEERPTRLTGYYKYKSAPISSVTEGYEALAGRPDTCIVWVALIDSDQPFEVRTNPRNRQIFDPEGSYVVAYGKMQTAESSDAYARFDIELEYKSTDRKPKYLLITASASKYGDYFTGGNGAVLYVDDLQLLYDF